MIRELQAHQEETRQRILKSFGINTETIAMSESEDYAEKGFMSQINIGSISEAEDIIKAAGSEELFEKAKPGDEREYQGRMYVYGTTKSGKMGWKVKEKVKRGSGTTGGAATSGGGIGTPAGNTGGSPSASKQGDKKNANSRDSLIRKLKSFKSDFAYVQVYGEQNNRPTFSIQGLKPQVMKTISQLNKQLGTDFSIGDFKRYKDRYGDPNYTIDLNEYTKEEKQGEGDKPKTNTQSKKLGKTNKQLSDDEIPTIDEIENAPRHSTIKIKSTPEFGGADWEKIGDVWLAHMKLINTNINFRGLPTLQRTDKQMLKILKRANENGQSIEINLKSTTPQTTQKTEKKK